MLQVSKIIRNAASHSQAIVRGNGDRMKSPVVGVLDEPYSAKPAQRSSHTCPPGYIGWTGLDMVPACVDWRACTATLLSGISWLRGSSKTSASGQSREYWMIYRGTGFLVAVWIGSSRVPTPSPVTAVRKLDRRFTERLRKTDNLLTGRGEPNHQIIDGDKAWSSIFHPIILSGSVPRLQEKELWTLGQNLSPSAAKAEAKSKVPDWGIKSTLAQGCPMPNAHGVNVLEWT